MLVSRACKILLVGTVSVNMALVALDNLLDYDANFEFVRHVLLMDDVFPNNPLTWRALTDPAWHRIFYGTIIAWESLAALVTAAGTVRMVRACRGDSTSWQNAKDWAEVGLALSLLLWYFAFLVVGGEWFQMWQAKTWNGQASAFRMFATHGLLLLYLKQRDE